MGDVKTIAKTELRNAGQAIAPDSLVLLVVVILIISIAGAAIPV